MSGPWVVYNRGIGWEVHRADMPDVPVNNGFRDTFTEADARLIAAAPDLLAACEAIIEEQSIGMYGAISNEGIAQLRAAVAKATDSEAAQ